MHTYIAYRNLKEHFFKNNCCGGPPVNNDYRFYSVKDCVYYLLTTDDNLNYAVSKETGDKFIDDVLNKCTAEHSGFFPLVPSSKSKLQSTEPVDTNKYYSIGTIPPNVGFMGLGMMTNNPDSSNNKAGNSFVSSVKITTTTGSINCPFCGADVTGKKFCTNCGQPR